MTETTKWEHFKDIPDGVTVVDRTGAIWPPATIENTRSLPNYRPEHLDFWAPFTEGIVAT